MAEHIRDNRDFAAVDDFTGDGEREKQLRPELLKNYQWVEAWHSIYATVSSKSNTGVNMMSAGELPRGDGVCAAVVSDCHSYLVLSDFSIEFALPLGFMGVALKCIYLPP